MSYPHLRSRCIAALALASGLIAAWTYAQAQTYPTKPIRLVLGFPAGTNVDILARPVALRMSEALGQQVIVDNRPGATGLIANELVAKSAPDGYTLLVAPGSSLTSTPHLRIKMPYDSLKDFVPIAQMNSFPQVALVNPGVPAKNVKELIALAREKPGVLTYGSSGVGSAFHLAGELFASMAKVKMLHVPYKGGNLALTDLIGGRIDVMFYSLAVALPQIKAGKVRAIAVTGLKHDALMPELPTVDESGLHGYDITGWHGFFAPAGTPREIVTRLNGVIGKILGTQEIRDLWASEGMEVVITTPEQFAQRMRADYEKYGRIVKAVGIKPE
ncbi:MAG TPA: tripartite tricarboxylate transporter substrate binding protein [Burkholderiales bacterium]|nr:tripartite tricarboxylate transporter substrate binding protein [Burkholderiales bacterium]